ncbi:MAG: hypothetical protein VYA69_01635 [Gemmatimonadota bacterium]|nr:hypothetical protein [Gemmatimonadota bacterium]
MSVLRHVRTLFIFTVLSGVLVISSCTQEPAPEPLQLAASTLEQVKGDLAKVKMAAANEGDYLCCVEPACDWCLLKEGECTCRINLEEGGEVCAGCGLGWHNGNGIIDGVKADDVEWNISHSHGEDSDEGGDHVH